MHSTRRGSRPETRDAHLEQVMRAIVHAEGHLGADLTLGVLARVGHVSEFHFQRVFRKLLGVSPAGFVRRIRLDRAAHQLIAGRLGIPAIAEACGYRELASFYRAFRARFGETPAAFRARASARVRKAPPRPECVRIWVNHPYEDGQLRYLPAPPASQPGRRTPVWRVVNLPVLRLAFLRGHRAADRERETFRALADFATRRQPAEDLVFLRLVHDDDRVTHSREGRVDRGVVFGPRRRGQGPIGARPVGGGRYVAVTAEGGDEALRRTRRWIEDAVIPEIGGTRADGPAIEVLLDDPRIASPARLPRLTDVLVPVEGVQTINWYWRRRRPPMTDDDRRTKR